MFSVFQFSLNNIGCFEISLLLYQKNKGSLLNNNIGCFEIWEYDSEDNLTGMLNNNIGCFEIKSGNMKLVKGDVKQQHKMYYKISIFSL